jgi:hypothetical protein
MEGSGSKSVQINYGSGCGSRRPKNIDPDADPELYFSEASNKAARYFENHQGTYLNR